mmetsp:Transcript_173475/g.556422  ORF Transcript_173475/g.556422 Transcript_173475/m.556422 type:complete len:246 (-) Transcript_173475:100-837(-)
MEALAQCGTVPEDGHGRDRQNEVQSQVGGPRARVFGVDGAQIHEGGGCVRGEHDDGAQTQAAEQQDELELHPRDATRGGRQGWHTRPFDAFVRGEEQQTLRGCRHYSVPRIPRTQRPQLEGVLHDRRRGLELRDKLMPGLRERGVLRRQGRLLRHRHPRRPLLHPRRLLGVRGSTIGRRTRQVSDVGTLRCCRTDACLAEVGQPGARRQRRPRTREVDRLFVSCIRASATPHVAVYTWLSLRNTH